MKRAHHETEISFADVLNASIVWTSKPRARETADEHRKAMEAHPLREFGPCQCAEFCGGRS